MKGKGILAAGLFAGAAALSGSAWGHPGGHSHLHEAPAVPVSVEQLAQAEGDTKTSGQGDLKFRLFATGANLPPEAVQVLVKAHGGFGVDRRDGKGEIYFALPGAGIIQLSPDLKQSRLIPTDSAVRDTNMHNTTVWYAKDGTPFLTFPANDANKVFTTTLDGKLVNTLESPEKYDFHNDTVNKYFADGGKFVPTDVAQLNDLFYITTGYSKLDYVLTANIDSTEPFKSEWKDLVFGGKGDAPGQFQTGHGITVSPDKTRLVVADRPKSELERFTPDGTYQDRVGLPQGSLPCDIAFESGYTVIGCLEGPDKTLGAPIYILKNDQLVSTIMPKEDLGLPNFVHIHNATMVTVNDTFYLIAQAWNPGDFAIFEQVK